MLEFMVTFQRGRVTGCGRRVGSERPASCSYQTIPLENSTRDEDWMAGVFVNATKAHSAYEHLGAWQ